MTPHSFLTSVLADEGLEGVAVVVAPRCGKGVVEEEAVLAGLTTWFAIAPLGHSEWLSGKSGKKSNSYEIRLAPGLSR